MLLPHHGHRGRATVSPALISRPAPKPHLSPTSSRLRHPHLARACPPPAPAPTRSRSSPASLRRRIPWNVMKPRFHCVLAQWIPGFTAPGARQQATPAPRPPRLPARPGTQPARSPNANRMQTDRNPLIRGKPFLTASNTPADYAESPTARTSPERIEGVSRSLPFSDLLALTSSHMFFSVMN